MFEEISLEKFFIEEKGKRYYTPLFLAHENKVSYFAIKNKIKKMKIAIKAKDIGVINSLSEELLVPEENLEKLFYDRRYKRNNFKKVSFRGVK